MATALQTRIQTNKQTIKSGDNHYSIATHYIYEGRSINKLQHGVILLIFKM